MLHILAACTPSDYAGGVNSFSQAVTQADATEQTLALAAQQASLDDWIASAQARNADVQFPDYAACRPVSGAYHSGDCAVKLAGTSAPAAARPTMTGLKAYASALSAVVADRTCAALQSDANDLAVAVAGIDREAKDRRAAAEAAPRSGLASSAACFIIQTKQVRLLRQATADANPFVQRLVPLIAHTDTLLQDDTFDAAAHRLQQAYLGYLRSRSTTDLTNVVTLAQALDQAQSAPVGPLIAKLAALHQTLTDDLAAPAVNLKRVESDAQSFIGSARTVSATARTLAAPLHPPATASSPAR